MKLTYDDILIVPNEAYVRSRSDIDVRTHFSRDKSKLPVMVSPMSNIQQTPQIVAEMNSSGFEVCLHRFMDIETRLDFLSELSGLTYTPHLIISLGMNEYFEDKERYIDEVKELSKYSTRFLVDTANGHNVRLYELIRALHSSGFTSEVIAGNVVTPSGANGLYRNGASGVRVGIGTSRICSSRLKTACGFPQFSAIEEIAGNMEGEYEIIADGGFKYIGDIAKALIFADKVMCGTFFAKTKEVCKESKGEYYGMASERAKRERGESANNIEGIETKLTPEYTIKELADEIEDGLRSSLSYVGARNLDEFREMVRYVQISPASQLENLVR